MSVLNIKNLTLHIGDALILSDITMDVQEGEAVAICGLSGAGKSQLARCIMRLEPENAKISGHISINDSDNICQKNEKYVCNMRGSGVFLIFQDAADSLTPTKRVGVQIRECLRLKGITDSKNSTLKILSAVGLSTSFYNRYPHQMSGGQRQRILVAMAIALQPRIIIADEPTSALDSEQKTAILELLHHVCQEHNMSLLLITHDLKIASHYCSRIIFIDKGQINSIIHSHDILNIDKANVTPLVRRFIACTKKMQEGYKNTDNIINTPHETLPLIEANNVTICYKPSVLLSFFSHNTTHTISYEKLCLYRGQCLGLIGVSGSGKTSIAHSLLGLKTLQNGTILQDGVSINAKDKRLYTLPKQAMIFQEPHRSFNPLYTVMDILKEAAYRNRNDYDDAQLRHKAEQVLQQCNIPKERLFDNITFFSGGEKQRISLARALMTEAPFIVADEALSALDSINRLDILELLMRIKQKGKVGLLFISHDIDSIMYIANEIAIVRDGRIAEIIDKKTFMTNNKQVLC